MTTYIPAILTTRSRKQVLDYCTNTTVTKTGLKKALSMTPYLDPALEFISQSGHGDGSTFTPELACREHGDVTIELREGTTIYSIVCRPGKPPTVR